MSMFTHMVKKMMKKGDDKRDAGLKSPSDIVRYDDLHYGLGRMRTLDVYKPKGQEHDKLPFIISIHGGGWVYGDKERYQYYCMSLAQRGFAVINFTYPLAPLHKFPSQLRSDAAVISWAVKHAEEYGFDLNNAFLLGDSAGGNMTAMICGLMHNPELTEKLKIKIDPAFKPKAVGLNCGVFVQEKPVKPADDDVQANQMYRFRLGLAKGTLGHSYLKKLRLASPYYYVNGDFPPAYIITALGDPLTKEQSELMDKKYTEMKVPHQFKCYGTPAKPLGHVFFCNMFEGEGTKAMDDELNYFKTFIS